MTWLWWHKQKGTATGYYWPRPKNARPNIVTETVSGNMDLVLLDFATPSKKEMTLVCVATTVNHYDL